MKKVFKKVNLLDQRCYENYGLSEDLLMEHAAMGLKDYIPHSTNSILIVAGRGNNGADAIALARMLSGDIKVDLYIPMGVKSVMGKLQLQRARKVNITPIDTIGDKYDVIVDALFGSGLSRKLDKSSQELIIQLNKQSGYKIACDIPSGIDIDGQIEGEAFKADITITMGSPKTALYSDSAKDLVGEIITIDLGISSKYYEDESDTFLLEKSDLKLPLRDKKNCHKGDFGHLCVVAGKKQGAAVIAAKAAYAFGTGLVTVVENEPYKLPYELMSSTTIPHKSSAICIGMGLGNQYDNKYLKSFLLEHNLPMLIDADLFYNRIILEILEQKNSIVITPHPKEFASLLSFIYNKNITVSDIQKDRFKHAREFSNKYPKVVLVLKGANTLIAHEEKIYIQPFGTNRLSKGGSGDVLGGLIASLLAQKYNPLEASITGSIAHALSAKNFTKNNYSLSPLDLIEGIKCL